MTGPRGGGFGARIRRTVSAAAGRLAGRDTPIRRAVSPIYTRVLSALSGGRGVDADINGESFRIDPRHRVFVQPDYEADVARYLRESMRPGQCTLDIGAHIGIYALQIARWTAPGGRVIAFEPNPQTADILRRHLAMNGLESSVRVEQAALGRAPGASAFFGTAGSGTSRLGAPNPDAPESGLSEITVPLQTVDAYCVTHAVSPDWMLVDVEGYEFDVLSGARDTIARRQSALSIVAEIHPALWEMSGASRARAEALLASLGRTPRGLTGQRDPLAEYGVVVLEPSA